MKKEGKKQFSIYLLFGVMGIAILLVVWLGEEKLMRSFTEEDGIVEYLSAVFYLIGFIICLYRILKKSRNGRLWLYLWCFLCFVFFGEETSWFQRLINYPMPSFLESINAQGEVNIHNLNIFQGGHWIEALSSEKYNMKMFLGSQNIFRLCFLIYFLIVPLFLYAGKLKFFTNKIHYPLPRVWFVIVTWFPIFLSFLLAAFSPEIVRASLAETREMLYSAFIFLYIYTHLG